MSEGSHTMRVHIHIYKIFKSVKVMINFFEVNIEKKSFKNFRHFFFQTKYDKEGPNTCPYV